MSEKSSAVRHHPFKHISIRVPWHDSDWNGTVCSCPRENASCLALNRILETKNEESESSVAGLSLKEIPLDQWPACVSERGSFMAPFEIVRHLSHPYAQTSEEHKHFKLTPFRHPIHSASAIPFRWMSRKYAWDLGEQHGLDVDPSREPTQPPFLKNNKWVQDHQNQKALLDFFFGKIEPDKSLCIFYTNQTPLAEDERRVIIGIGKVKHVGNLTEYDYSSKKKLRSYIWDRTLQHSIHPNFTDGFLLPYRQILELAEADPSIELSDYVAFAPEERREEFSYVSEHVTHDAAIASLLSCKNAIEKAKKVVDGPWDSVLKWIDVRLSELWELRGPYPGLGVALTAFGVEYGSLLAYELSSQIEPSEDPWPLVDNIFKNPSQLTRTAANMITNSLRAKWVLINTKKPERLQLLKLIARMELTVDQATRFYVEEERKVARIMSTDADILSNPYLLYQDDRDSLDAISVWTVDRGVFPASSIRESHPLPKPSALDDNTDIRRVRALVVDTLEHAASAGHTLMSRGDIVLYIRSLAIDPVCSVDGDLLEALNLSPAVLTQHLKDGTPAYQLERLTEMGKIIRNSVEKRVKAKRHLVDVDWKAKLDKEFGSISEKEEIQSRIEKEAALKELAESRISVLIGAAGTGKTTLLSLLCSQPEISNGGVLLLAPTGKARVRLQQATKHTAQTLAQFLLDYDRYDVKTGKYRVSSKPKSDNARTVIVDESSMLTEEQLAALIDALKNVDRYILVGDPCQLPPIGAGRPFVDIVNYLKPENVESMPTKVSNGYAELTIKRRQTGEDREDLQLAELFSGRPLAPGEDEVINGVQIKPTCKHICLVQWQDTEQLRQKLLSLIVNELNLKNLSDQAGFDQSLGGSCNGTYVYFNKGSGRYADNWQVMSPVKGMPYGVCDLNRLIQRTFRSGTRELAISKKHLNRRQIPKVLGSEGIVYGDKVMNTINNPREGYPKESSLNYVANGEIGIAVSPFISKKEYESVEYKKIAEKLRWLNIEFSSQLGCTYGYSSRDFKEERNPILELAYAITVHKSQGSEFGLCILILPNPCKLISREMLYTALTRQRDRIVILHKGEFTDFLKYGSDSRSETIQRMTNLFSPPSPKYIMSRFLEENLINVSEKGELMRSKSEVIIANILADKGIEYEYERIWIGTDGQRRYPDFTIEDSDSGITYLWEHCGMMGNKEYRDRWNRKREWYHQQGILPFEEGGGTVGTLIISSDTPEGGIDSKKIKEIIEKVWAL